MLNMMILASGSSLRIRRINSKPETSGRLISMTCDVRALADIGAVPGFGVGRLVDTDRVIGW